MANVIEFTIKALDDFSAGMDKLTGDLGKFEKMMVGLGVVGLAYKGLRMAQESLEHAEALGVAAEKANMLVEEYSAMEYAAKMSNVEAGSLAQGLKMLNRAMGEGDTTPAGRQLEALGISARDASGNLRPTKDVMLELADVFAHSANDANKTKAAMELLSRAGVDMVPFLNQGSEGIKQMMEEAAKLGQVIGSDFSPAADQINDNLKKMSLITEGQVNVAMKAMAPLIETVTEAMVNFSSQGDKVQSTGEMIATALKLTATVGLVVAETFKTAGAIIGGVAATIAAYMTGEYRQAWESAKSTATDVIGNITTTVEAGTAIWNNSMKSQAAETKKASDTAMAHAGSIHVITAAEEKARKDAEALTKAIEDMTAATLAQINNFGRTSEEIKLYELAAKGATGADYEKLKALVALQAAMDENVKNYDKTRTLIDSLRTPEEQHLDRMRELGVAYENGSMSNDRYVESKRREILAWEDARLASQQYKDGVTDVMVSVDELVGNAQKHAGSVAYQTAVIIQGTFDNLAKGIGDAVARSIVEGASLSKGLEAVLKNVVTNMISSWAAMQIQRAIYAVLGNKTEALAATGKIASSAGVAYAGTFADVATNMPYGWMYAAGIAAATAAEVEAGGMALVAAGGVAHGGLDYVPKEQTYLLDKGERVLSPNQNSDLTSFMQQGSGGGVSIQNLQIHILENATNADVFARMDRIQLRNALGQPIIDALNEMFTLGIRPNFATQSR